jgi:phage terminase Nu1 subunit (DNA packaging protein)
MPIGERDPESLVEETEAAEILSIRPRTLQAWRCKGCGPDFVKLQGRLVRYRVRVLLQWIEDQTRKLKPGTR